LFSEVDQSSRKRDRVGKQEEGSKAYSFIGREKKSSKTPVSRISYATPSTDGKLEQRKGNKDHFKRFRNRARKSW